MLWPINANETVPTTSSRNEPEPLSNSLLAWSNSTYGCYLHSQEQALIKALIPSHIRRQHAVQMGQWGREHGRLLSNSTAYSPRPYELDWRIPLPAASAAFVLMPPRCGEQLLSQDERVAELNRISCDGAWAVLLCLKPGRLRTPTSMLPPGFIEDSVKTYKQALSKQQWQLLHQQAFMAWPKPLKPEQQWLERSGRWLWPWACQASLLIACKQRTPLLPLGQRLLNLGLPTRRLRTAAQRNRPNHAASSRT